MQINYIALVMFVITLIIIKKYDFFSIKINPFPNKKNIKNILFSALTNMFAFIIAGAAAEVMVISAFAAIKMPPDGLGIYISMFISAFIAAFLLYQFTDIYQR